LSRSIYEITQLRHRYGAHTVLEIRDLRIMRGSIVGLVGPNGSGKSTLMRILAFVESPSEGMVRFEGRGVRPNGPSVRHDVSLLLQDPYLLKRSVFENIAYGPKVRGETKDLKERVQEALLWVGLDPETFAFRAWYELSGGEAQRVALASRLILRPKALLLDEPTASVDAASAQLIQEASVRARDEWGTTLVIASHNIPWLYRVSDQVMSLFNGRVVGFGAESLIAGPWIQTGDELFKKVFPDGQQVIISPPPNHDAVAVLDPSHVEIKSDRPTGNSGLNVLNGTISQMIYENRSGGVIVNISVCNTFLTSRITHPLVQELGLHPGRTVWVSFKPASIRWI
jgi:tungstate transport system ATP-binding protein